MISIPATQQTEEIFLHPTGEADPYHEQFEKTLAVIEKDESKGWDPGSTGKKDGKNRECKNPRQRYIIASFEQKLAVVIKIYPSRKMFRMILQDHYKVK